MADRIRAGIVGVGFMGTVHARAVRRAGGVVSRIVGSSPESSRAGAERIGAEFAAESVEELLAADDVDVVHVCTPNATHAPLVRAAIAAGKHVICEKPLAVDAAEAAELVALAAEAGVTATVPFVYRFYPTVREARSRVADGTAGPVRLLHGSYLQDWLVEDTDDNWRVDAAAGGASRAFADIGVHWCDLVEFVSGHRITRVAARTVVAHPTRGGRTRHHRGRRGRAVRDRPGRGRQPDDQPDQPRPEEPAVVLRRRRGREPLLRPGEPRLAVDRRPGGQPAAAARLERGPRRGALLRRPGRAPAGLPGLLRRLRRRHLRAIAGEAPDGLPTFADGLRAARITEAVLESSRTSSWVGVA